MEKLRRSRFRRVLGGDTRVIPIVSDKLGDFRHLSKDSGTLILNENGAGVQFPAPLKN